VARKSAFTGDNFLSAVQADGSFALCLPAAFYTVFAAGEVISFASDIEVPIVSPVQVEGFAEVELKAAPPNIAPISAGMANMIADIEANNPAIIGLGEATHGTSEFTSRRGELTLELIRHASVRLILIEVDAINGAALDDYVNGMDVDIAKAVADLGFWVTDTYEFLQFLERVRNYNAGTSDKVHVWGIDLQNTVLPVNMLLANAATLTISTDDQDLLKVAAIKRGKEVSTLTSTQRSSLAGLISRLEAPRSQSRQDVLIAVAARSLALQLGYWDGDMQGQYRSRRDFGMASMTRFLFAQLGVKRACLWAHDGHVAKHGPTQMLGQHLAQGANLRYYAIGFYLYEGSTRAWDGAQKIGVISHPISRAPVYAVEGAVMRMTGMPDVAWLPLRGLPKPFQTWLDRPRFVREVGAQYVDADEAMVLRYVRRAFDALVVIKNGHDSSPTPTGIRTATRK
jgi:erythromycin esterase